MQSRAHALATLLAVGSTPGAPGTPAPARAQTLPDDAFYVTNGTVYASALSGNTLYIGGWFTHVGPATGGGVPIGTATAQPVGTFPKVTGNVMATASDGAGGWFIGGNFTAVGGVARTNLAHVLADNSVAAWDPGPTFGAAAAYVYALAVSGSTVYVGGSFTNIGGQARNHLAAVDASTGLATAWDPNPTGALYPYVYALAVSGPTVFVGGHFDAIGGLQKRCLGAVSAATGLASNLFPSVTPEVKALAVSGSTLFVGGTIQFAGSQQRLNLAAVDATTGSVRLTFAPQVSGEVSALAVSGSTLYVGGNFPFVNGVARNCLAAVDATSGALGSWDPNVTAPDSGNPDALGVKALTVNGSIIYVGGGFTAVGGQTRSNLAAVDAATALPTAWDPTTNATVFALGASGSTVYAGGEFTSIGGELRRGIASLDVTTGAVTDWNPDPDGQLVFVLALAVDGPTVYAGGEFWSIGGQPRNRLAAVDATSGLATPWDPNPDSQVAALLKSGSTVYVGGGFANIGGQARSRIAALNAATGLATSWNPNPTGTASVSVLVMSGSTLYVGGLFSNMGGQPRSCLAAVDASTGLATPFDPNFNSTVYTLALSGSTLYAGGSFTSIGGQPRSCIGAVNAVTGAVTPWDPNATSPDFTTMGCLVVDGSTVYAGGRYTGIGGQPRNRLAALDATTGLASDWDPNAVGGNPCTVLTMIVSGSRLYAGGEFLSMGGTPHSNLAALPIPSTSTAAPEAASDGAILYLQPNWPNPFHGSTQIRFSLPGAANVSMTVYDLAGRRVATPIKQQRLEPGAHEVEFDGRGLASGVYLCRLQAGDRVDTRRLVHFK